MENAQEYDKHSQGTNSPMKCMEILHLSHLTRQTKIAAKGEEYKPTMRRLQSIDKHLIIFPRISL